MSKAKQYHDQSIADLEATYLQLRSDLFALINQKKRERKLENPHRLPHTKREIARVLTVLHSKRSAHQQDKGA